MKRKGIRLTDLAYRLKWLCKKEVPTEDEDWNDVDDQGYGYTDIENEYEEIRG